MITVLDSSVIAKWYFEEVHQKEALGLLNLLRHNKIIIYVPPLLLFELGNIFLNQKVTEKKFFSESVSTLLRLNINIIELTEELLNLIFKIALNHKITFYDATYVALAQNLKCDFITADKKLYQKTKPLKFIRLLGDI